MSTCYGTSACHVVSDASYMNISLQMHLPQYAVLSMQPTQLSAVSSQLQLLADVCVMLMPLPGAIQALQPCASQCYAPLTAV